MTVEPLIVIVPAETAGERLDKVLAGLCPQSRTTLQRWIEEGRVQQAGAVASRKTRAEAGAEVTVEPAPPEVTEAVPQDIPIAVLFEDEHLIVVDKPARLVVHPAPGHPDGTLVNALLYHAKLGGGADPLRPGIVHRLDKDTSGVMVVAKTAEAHERLVVAFQERTLERSYLGIAVGHTPAAVTYETLHSRHPTDRKRFTSLSKRGKRAVTHVETVEHLFGTSLVQCKLETGRTHQIRVHLADAGHPLLGDPMYGGSLGDPRLRAVGQALGRQALHAAVLGFAHPITGKPLRFQTQPPADFGEALAELRRLRPTT